MVGTTQGLLRLQTFVGGWRLAAGLALELPRKRSLLGARPPLRVLLAFSTSWGDAATGGEL